MSISHQIEQDFVRVPEGQDKFALLIKLLDDREFEKVLIYNPHLAKINCINWQVN